MSARSERSGALLLGDLRELNLAAADCNLAWTVLGQGANVHRDQELLEVVYKSQFETGRVIHWIESRTKQTAPQVLSV
jgi:hypothetical protein